MKKKLLLLTVVGAAAVAASFFWLAGSARAEEKQSPPPSQVRMDAENDSPPAVADKPEPEKPVKPQPDPEIAPPVPVPAAQATVRPAEIPVLDLAALPAPEGGNSANEERVFREMDRLNLEIARVQMEMKLASLQIQKLQLEVQKAKLQEELAQHRTEQGGNNGYAAATLVPPITEGAPALLSIMAYGDQKSAILKIGGRTQEVKEGESVDILGTISRIEPESDSIVVSKGGVERRVYVLGNEKNNG